MYKEELEEAEIEQKEKKPEEKSKKKAKPLGKKYVVYRVGKNYLVVVDEKENGFRIPMGKRKNVKPGDSIFME